MPDGPGVCFGLERSDIAAQETVRAFSIIEPDQLIEDIGSSLQTCPHVHNLPIG
jgi:hypothetical protein